MHIYIYNLLPITNYKQYLLSIFSSHACINLFYLKLAWVGFYLLQSERRKKNLVSAGNLFKKKTILHKKNGYKLIQVVKIFRSKFLEDWIV
jgi:hypothetical protein